MIHYSSVVSIRRSPEDVYAALLDPDRYSSWTEMVGTRFEGVGAPQVGTRGEFRLPRGPLKGRYEMEFTTLEPGRRVDVHIDGAALRWQSRIALVPDGAGTRMTYAGDISLLGWRRFLEPLLAREAQAGEAREAEQLRDVLEAEAGATAAPRVSSLATR